jgi:hypothetical protein
MARTSGIVVAAVAGKFAAKRKTAWSAVKAAEIRKESRSASFSSLGPTACAHQADKARLHAELTGAVALPQ